MARRPNLDMDVLRTFVTGFELGSFARAADRLGRSQSAISTQLRKLEEQMGQPLVRKSGRGLLPTPAGERLLAYARRILDLNDETVGAVRDVEFARIETQDRRELKFGSFHNPEWAQPSAEWPRGGLVRSVQQTLHLKRKDGIDFRQTTGSQLQECSDRGVAFHAWR